MVFIATLQDPSAVSKTLNDFNAKVYIQGSQVFAVNANGQNITAPGTAGANDAATIQAALNSLTASRTVQEKVLLIGSFTAESQITIPSYTIVDMRAAKVTAKNSLNTSIFQNSDTVGGNTFITVIGGQIQGNQANQTGGNGLNFDNTTYLTVEDCYMTDCYSHGIRVTNSSNFTINRCRSLSNGTQGRVSDGILIITNCSNGKITNNNCSSNGRIGITLDYNASTHVTDVIISNNICNSNSAGIWIEGGDENTVVGNICNSNTKTTQTSKSGIVLGGSCSRNVITGNYCANNSTRGVDAAVGASIVDVIINGNYCYTNGAQGININCTGFVCTSNICKNNVGDGILLNTAATSGVVADNECSNNATGASFTYDGISIEDACIDIVVTGNRCYDNAGSPKQYRGINVQGTADYIYARDNQVRGNVLAVGIANSSSGTHNSIKDNSTYVTENTGNASITSGTTSVVVTHGCSYTPAASDISLLVTATSTNDYGTLYVDTITATQFTIHCRADPGASNLAITWTVRKII